MANVKNRDTVYGTAGNTPMEKFKSSVTLEKMDDFLNAHVNTGIEDGLFKNDTTNGKVSIIVQADRQGKDSDVEEKQLRPNKSAESPKFQEPEVLSVAIRILYITKKNLVAQGVMDIVLLMAIASQLYYIIQSPYWDVHHRIIFVLLSISIAFQMIASVLLLFISRYDYNNRKKDRAIILQTNYTIDVPAAYFYI